MPRLVKKQGDAMNSTAQESLMDEPPLWIKLTDVFGDIRTGKVANLIRENKPIEYGAVAAVPNTYFVRYGSHDAAEAVMQSTLNLEKEYIKIDPVALFPDWENETLILPELFVEPTITITCTILKLDASLQETESQVLDTLCNRAQRRWRFSRRNLEITVYLASEDGVEATKKLASLVPPGYRLTTTVVPLHRSLPLDLRGVEQRTVGCIRTPVSKAKTQRQSAGHPYPIPSLKEFEIRPLWKVSVTTEIQNRIQHEISTKLVSVALRELVSYQLTEYGVLLNAKDDTLYRRLYEEYNGKVLDAVDAEIYSLQIKTGRQALANAQKGTHPPPSNHTETGGNGKAKQRVKGTQKGGQAEGGEDVPIVSPRSCWRLAKQAASLGKPWIRTPWRPEKEPLNPAPLPHDYDVPIPTDIETLQKKVALWNSVNQVPQPGHETLNAALGELPTEGDGLAVMAQMRAGTANPFQLVKELSKMGKRIGPLDAAVYYLWLRVTLGKIMLSVRRISRIQTARRRQICHDLTTMVTRLKASGCTDNHEIHLLYTGVTTCLMARSAFDIIDIIHLGPNEEENRRPATILMDFAADVYSLEEFGIVTFEDDGVWLWGDPDVVHNRLPKVLRIPVIATNDVSEDVKKVAEQTAMGAMHPPHFNVRPGGSVDYDVQQTLVNDVVDEIADVVDPMEDVLWLSDAPGTKGRAFGETHTGTLAIHVMRKFLSNDEAFTVEPLDFHGLDHDHPSNIIVCTTPEIIFVIDGIKPRHIFVVLMGSMVALYNAIKHLFGGKMKAEDVLFFEPYEIEYKQVQRIFLLIPHPGVNNYIPHAKWAKEAFAQGLARICLIAATVKRLKSSILDSHVLVAQTLTSVKSSPLNTSLETTLSLYGIRAPWNGATASNIANMMDYQNVTFEQALSVVSPKKNRGIITSLRSPTPDHLRNDVPIVFPHVNHKLAYVGQMSFSVFCPASPKTGVPRAAVKSISIDARWRSKVDDVEGYLIVDPSTMELKFEIIGGGILVSDEGEPFIIKRSIWMTSTSLGAGHKILENLLRASSSWKPLTDFEAREIQARNDKESYRIVSRSNLVHTFLAKEVEDGLDRGDVSLIKIGATAIDLRVWKQSLQAFVLLHPHEWQVPPKFFENSKGATHFTVTYNFLKKRWEFPLYEISERKHWKPEYLGVLDQSMSSLAKPASYLVKNGETTELFKMQKLQFENKLQGGRAGSNTG